MSSGCHTTFAVRRVCAPTLYCDRIRPVVSSSGKRGPTFSSVGTYSVMQKLPMPRTKPPMCITGVPSGALSLHGHWTEPSASFANDTPANVGVVRAISSMICDGCV